MSLITFIDETKRPHYASLVNSIKRCSACQFCDLEGVRDIGNGFIPADVFFLGEAEGADERITGIPFIGDCGQLIRRKWNEHGFMFDNINLNGGQIKSFVSNSIKCWPYPPEGSGARNGKPTPESIEACKIHTWIQLKLCMPKVVVPLGDIATRTILSVPFDNTKWRITDALRQDHERNWPILGRVRIVPMYHPSYVLRQGKPANLMSLYDLLLNKVKGILNVL